jgi:glycosyltransferase involved in cell wall biosynthesis
MKEKDPIFLYWGRRGGGFRMTDEFLSELGEFKHRKVVVSVRTDLFQEHLEGGSKFQNINIKFKNSFLKTFFSPPFYKSVYEFISMYGDHSNPRPLIIFMSSPLDTIIGGLLNKKFEVWRVIHDHQRHKGDFWPTTRQIEKWIRRDRAIVLSNFVYRRLSQKTNKEILVASLIRKSTPKTGLPLIERPYCLITGRGKKYQRDFSLDLIAAAIPVKIVITGSFVPKKLPKNVLSLKGWLANKEMENLIRYANATFCLYSEASQSGVVEQSLSFNVPVIAFKVGGLEEQIRQGIDGFLISNVAEISSVFSKLEKLNRDRVGMNRTQKTVLETLKIHGLLMN